MKHPLHDAEFLEMIGKKNPCRRTGRSTAYAFRYISEAIINPNTPIRIIDHYRTHEANRMLAQMIGDIIQKTGLKHMTINGAELTLTFGQEKA